MLTNTDINPDAAVVALTADGEELWRQSLNGTAQTSDAINTLAFSGNTVIAGGFLTYTGNRPIGIVATFHSETGTELDRRSVKGTGDFGQNSVASVVTHGNTVLFAGVITNQDTAQDMYFDEFVVGGGLLAAE